jgi:hypothetical protein
MRGWSTVDWLTILATVTGGAAALLGTVIAHSLRSRDERRRTSSTARRDSYVAYLVALDAGYSRLRQLADPDDPPENLEVQTRRAAGEAGIYEARERLLLVGNPPVLGPAERVLQRLGRVRQAVRDGAKLHTPAFHDAYHPYAEALWHLRTAIRADLGSTPLTPADVEKESWDSQASCDFCRRRQAAGSDPQPAAAN